MGCLCSVWVLWVLSTGSGLHIGQGALILVARVVSFLLPHP